MLKRLKKLENETKMKIVMTHCLPLSFRRLFPSLFCCAYFTLRHGVKAITGRPSVVYAALLQKKSNLYLSLFFALETSFDKFRFSSRITLTFPFAKMISMKIEPNLSPTFSPSISRVWLFLLEESFLTFKDTHDAAFIRCDVFHILFPLHSFPRPAPIQFHQHPISRLCLVSSPIPHFQILLWNFSQFSGALKNLTISLSTVRRGGSGHWRWIGTPAYKWS